MQSGATFIRFTLVVVDSIIDTPCPILDDKQMFLIFEWNVLYIQYLLRYAGPKSLSFQNSTLLQSVGLQYITRLCLCLWLWVSVSDPVTPF